MNVRSSSRRAVDPATPPGRRSGGDDRILAVEPENRDAVVVGRFAVAALCDRGGQRAVGGVELDVATDAQRVGMTRDEWTVLLPPVAVELVRGQLRPTAQDERDDDHALARRHVEVTT